jgi:hypothetical protein
MFTTSVPPCSDATSARSPSIAMSEMSVRLPRRVKLRNCGSSGFETS